MPGTEDEVRVLSQDTDDEGRPVTHTTLSPTDDEKARAILPPPPAVIPVIFLPGIMGTNLMGEDGTKLWSPPNADGPVAILGAVGQMFAYLFRGAATRQRTLNPKMAKVDIRGSIDAESSMKKKVAMARGWGALMRSAYHPVMALMQKRLNNLMEDKKALDWWKAEGLHAPTDYGDEKGSAALNLEDFKHAAHYRFEVWGGGYNWLQSNKDSAADLMEYIDMVLDHHRSKKEIAEKVILVTHSMGGLVARALVHVHGYDKILGVVHGVMPATGAPATYHHCRCGYDGVSQIILGKNAKEVVAVVGNAPGAMELLPSADYGEGRAWLKLGGLEKSPSHSLPLGDPYDEIYLSREWYGLVPQESEGMLNPASTKRKLEEEGLSLSPFNDFDDRVDDTRDFHESISGKYPSPAYVHYGADERVKGWADVHWEGGEVSILGKVKLEKDNGNGKISLITKSSAPAGESAIPVGNVDSIALVFGKASQPGDGTVPTISGAAPSLKGVAASFRQGNQGLGEYVTSGGKGKDKGYEHQTSYNDPRTQWATLFSVVKMSREADWA